MDMNTSRLGRSLVLLITCALLALPAAAQGPAKAKDAKAAVTKTGPLLDINSASVDQLKNLPGIGDAYSKKIVDNRPYSGKDDLVNKNIIPQATYDKIKDMIIARQTKAKPTPKK